MAVCVHALCEPEAVAEALPVALSENAVPVAVNEDDSVPVLVAVTVNVEVKVPLAVLDPVDAAERVKHAVPLTVAVPVALAVAEEETEPSSFAKIGVA